MKKILIIGNGGAGKSTLAVELGQLLRLPVYHLDKYFWQPGWIEPDGLKWRADVKRFVSKPEWIIEGNFGSTFDLRMPPADTILLLDFHRLVCLWHVIKRIAVSYNRVRDDMADGCPEKIDFQFFNWVWNFNKRSRPQLTGALTQYGDGKTIVIFKNSRQLKSYLDQLREDL